MPLLQGRVQRAWPGFSADASAVEARLTRRKEVIAAALGPSRLAALEEGTYVAWTHQTPGTAVSGTNQTAFAATNALVLIANTSPTSLSANGRCFVPDFIRLSVTTAPTTAASGRFALAIDRANRYSSGGTQFAAQTTNPSASNPATADLDFRFGALTLTAAGANTRYLAAGMFRSVIPVVLDQILFEFDGNDGGPQDIAGTTAKVITCKCPPVLLEPATNAVLILHIWYPAATAAAAYEFSAAGWLL